LTEQIEASSITKEKEEKEKSDKVLGKRGKAATSIPK
tara:strand:+ start:151 stop:261 length:111 start_codon:yes stop_codon:yes gene_type:complete